MFEFNNKEYTLEQIQAAAEQSNMKVDDYIKQYKIKELGKTTPTSPGADVEETAAPELTVTESPSVDISLESPQTETVDSTVDLQPKDDRAGFLGSIALSPSKIPANIQKQGIGLRDMVLLTIDRWINPELSRKERVAKLNEYFNTDDDPIAGYPGLGIIRTADTKNEAEEVVKEIRNKQLKTESLSIYESIEKGNVVDAAFLAADGLIQTLPSIAFSAYGGGGIIAHGALIAGEKFNDEYLNNPEASESAIIANALGTGAIQAGADFLFRGLMKTSGVIAKEGSAQQAKQFLSNGISRIASKYLAVPAEGLVEVSQDLATKGLDDLTLGRDFYENINKYELIDNFLLGTLMQGGVTVTSYMSGANADQVAYAEGLLMPENVKPVLESYAENYSNIANQISKEQNPEAQQILKNQLLNIEGKISTLRRKYRTSLYAMNDAELTEYATNKDRIEKIKSGIQNATTREGKRILYKEIDNLNKENAEILKDATTRKFEETTAQAEADAKKLGIDFTVIETAQEFDEYIKSKGGDSEALYSGNDGAILPLPNNKQEIVINQEIALQEQAVNVASHELLHAVLNRTLLGKGAASENLANALIEELGKIDVNKVADSDLARRLRAYSAEPEAVQYEEVLTLFSDALATGDIKFNEGLFTKIGDTTRRLFSGFGKEIKFNSGRDVFNFIKDFNNSVDKGIIKGAKKGFKGKLVNVQKIQEEIQEEVKLFSKSKEASNRVQEIYEAQGAANAMDIIDEFKPITNKIVNKYRDVPGFEFELLRDEIETGKRGILDMIMAYTPEKAKGAPLAAYINSLLPKRAIEAANRILDTEFKADVTEARGVTDTTTEEATEAVEEKPTKELTSLRKVMELNDEIKPVIFSAVRKTFGTVLPNVDDKTFRKELEKRYRTELKKPIAKLFGKGEEYRSFLANNFESIYNALPQSIFNKRLKEFAEPVLDKEGKQLRERTAEGNKVFTKKKITKAEFIKYFLGDDVKRSTQGTRKTAIVEAVAEAFAFDATMEVLSKPEVAQKAMDIAELQGVELSDNFVDKVSNIIGRPVNFKFSKTRNALNLPPGSINFKNESQVLSARGSLLKLAKMLGPEKTVQYLLPTVQGGWGAIGGKFVPKKDINKLTVRELQYSDDKNSFRTNQFLFLGRADFFEEAKKVFDKVEYKKRDRSVNINGNQISILAVPTQTPKGFTSGSFEGEELQNRLYFAQIQREGLKSIINTTKQLYENNDITKNDVGMILASFNSSINALIRTAAYPGLQFKIDGLQDSDYRYEHTQTASDTLTELAKYITVKDYKFTFDKIMQGFRVAIIPKKYDNIVNSTGFKSNGPRDNNGDLIKGKSTDVIRYKQKEVVEKFKNESLPDLELEDLLNDNLSIKFSKSLDKEFNQLLQATTKVDWTKEFSPVKAKLLGRGKGKKIFIPYSADDFVGLLYATLGKKEVGNKQMEWYNENLLRPYSRAIQQYEAQKQKSLKEWMVLKKEAAKDVPGGLKKQNDSGFTNQDSVRIYIWRKQGMEIEGLDAESISENLEVINNNPKLKEFADRLMALNPEGYPPPSIDWSAGDITTDLVSYINDVKRSEYLTQWKENVAEIFNDRNKNKLKALYGDAYVKALDNMLYRMDKGRNRYKDASDAEKAFMNWTNNSVGAIMFFNARSAVLQTLSSVNFINFSDNNPINASLAFLNQKQYWNDFSTLFNSDFLKQRRTGLQTDINADEIANAAATSKNKARAVLSAILKFGFTPTQIADSFAIASGGATMYRNRIKKYLKEGLSKEEAETKAFTDFQEIAEETQQSARPDRISMQQAGSLGRLILAFGNTPMQYARLTKKATLDLINGRGDWKTNISKIAYYSVIQNIIFSALQQGMFALLFDDEDDKEVQSRLFRIGNSSADTLLRGIGVYGAAAATVKNMIFKIIEESEKSRPDYKQLAIEATSLSPPINSKLRKLESAGKTFTYKQSKEKVFTEGFSLENPAFLAAGKVVSAGTNLPADRVVQKMDHIYTAMQPETELWQGIALALGWGEWELGLIEKQTKKSPKPKTTFKTKSFQKGFKRKKFKTN